MPARPDSNWSPGAWSAPARSVPARTAGTTRPSTPPCAATATCWQVLDVLARQVHVRAVFSDWPATTTFYANCTGLD